MYKEKNKTFRFCLQSLLSARSLSTFLFLLFTFLFVFAQSVSSNDGNSRYNYSQKLDNSDSSAKSYFNNKHHNNLPPDSTPESNEEKSSDENELTEDTNNILDFTACNSVFYNFNTDTCINLYLYQLKQKLQNRFVVALFVLHHSWKSFLI